MNKTLKNLLKGLMLVVLFYLIFLLIYVNKVYPELKPWKNNMIMLMFLLTIIFFIYDLINDIKHNKKKDLFLDIVFISLIIVFFIIKAIIIGTVLFRYGIYTWNIDAVINNTSLLSSRNPTFIRFFGVRLLLKIPYLLFNNLNWQIVSLTSYFIISLGFIAFYKTVTSFFSQEKKVKNSKNSTLFSPAILSLLILFLFIPFFTYSGSEEQSFFSVGFLMISYYYLFNKNPLKGSLAFLTASFMRTEIILLFPFYLAQHIYLHGFLIDQNKVYKLKTKINTLLNYKQSKTKNIVKEDKLHQDVKLNKNNFEKQEHLEIFKKKEILYFVFNCFLIFLLLWNLFFLLGGVSSFYSKTTVLDQGEVYDPSYHLNLLSYFKVHFTVDFFDRIVANINQILFNFFGIGNPSLILSFVIFLMVILSILLNLKDKRIHILVFNLFFFFFLYPVLRFEGFTHFDSYIKYGIYFATFYALIIPFIFKKSKIDRKTDVFLSLILTLVLFSMLFSYPINLKENLYLSLTKEETIDIRNQLNYSYPFVFIPAPNELLIYDPPSRFTYFEYLPAYNDLRFYMNRFNSESFYVFLHPYDDWFYKYALNERFCKDIDECKLYLNQIVNIIENEYNMTKIIDLSEYGDYGAIYFKEI